MKKKYLVNCMQDRKNNLDIIRFIAAILVIFSHSYPITQNSNTKEPLFVFTNHQSTLGGLAVASFFILSGFLITQSYERSRNVYTYLKSRVLRIFPGLLVCLLFSAFILGPILTNLSIKEYFSNSSVYKYLIGITLLPNLSPSLPGVFVNNPYGSFVNGSLWTLKFEFFFYIFIAFLGITKLLRKNIMFTLYIFFNVFSLFNINENLHNLFLLGSFFFGGSLLYLLRNKIILSGKYAIISLLLILISTKLGLFNLTLAIFGSYLIIYIGYQQKIQFVNFSKYGDFSYGIYIYAFPIQQSVIAIFGLNMTPLQNFLISLPVILILAFLSWHLVEKNALKLKHTTIFKKPGATSSTA